MDPSSEVLSPSALTATTSQGSASSLIAAACRYATAELAPQTRRAYAADWTTFEHFCGAHALRPLPASASTVALHLSALAERGRRPSTIQRAAVAIAQAHKFALLPSPTTAPEMHAVMRGIRRMHATRPRQKAVLLVDDVRTLSAALPDSRIGPRNRAMLVVGFAGALRRAELVALDVHDARITRECLELTIRRSKTDASGAGHTLYLPCGNNPLTCPVRTLQAWLERSGVHDGPLFVACGPVRLRRAGKRLHGYDVARLLQRLVALGGGDHSAVGGHSLRRGFITSAIRAGKRPDAVMRRSRHKLAKSMQTYIEAATGAEDSPARGIGL